MKDYIRTVCKGATIGGTMLVPGVSGGSMAMLLGIYDRLILSVSSFLKDIKKNVIFLLLFTIGAGIGMLMFAKPLLFLIEEYNKPVMYFFMGAVAGGVPMIYRQARVTDMSWKHGLYIVIGFFIVLIFAFVPEETFVGGANDVNIFRQIIAGVIAAVALVLPGISVSYMLLLMGVYDRTVEAIGALDIVFLLPMAIGLFVGIVLITKALENAMKKCPQITYLVILGFVIGSVVQVFPGIPQNYDWVLCGVLFIAGYYIIHSLSKSEA